MAPTAPTEHTTSTQNGTPQALVIALPVALVLLIAVSFLVMKSRWPGAFVPPRGSAKKTSEDVLSRRDLDNLALYKFREKDSRQSTAIGRPQLLQSQDRNHQQHCSICTEAFKKGVTVRQLPCDHLFHDGCIDPWLLRRSNTCPLCRAKIQPLSADLLPSPPKPALIRSLISGRADGQQQDYRK